MLQVTCNTSLFAVPGDSTYTTEDEDEGRGRATLQLAKEGWALRSVSHVSLNSSHKYILCPKLKRYDHVINKSIHNPWK
jgi:hypothetical protein